MPIRSGAMQRPSGCRCGNTLRQRYEEVGLPCNSTMGSPCPTSTNAISRPRTRRRCFWYGNLAEIIFGSPLVANFAVWVERACLMQFSLPWLQEQASCHDPASHHVLEFQGLVKWAIVEMLG